MKPVERIAEAGPDSDMASGSVPVDEGISPLTFRFAPEFQGIINPDPHLLPEGCDAWALALESASVTALAASFAESSIEGLRFATTEDRLWKL